MLFFVVVSMGNWEGITPHTNTCRLIPLCEVFSYIFYYLNDHLEQHGIVVSASDINFDPFEVGSRPNMTHAAVVSRGECALIYAIRQVIT